MFVKLDDREGFGLVVTCMSRFVGGVQVFFLLLVISVGCNAESKPESARESDAVTGDAQGSPANAGAGSGATSPQDRVADVVRVRVVKNAGSEAMEGEVEWTPGMTVFDVLDGFSPSLAVSSTGQGESLFVKSIAGQENLGSAGDNWVFRVNGQLGDRSCGIIAVSPGDEVVWSFGKYQ